ncbi:MAG TPA: HAMP domain-containing sensor histidine kinase, partial [Thermoanaerobaculia bacterium]|nr:HAMP domain-containing sensor histidine kinase [Thermoanaerobaculia bacterium]
EIGELARSFNAMAEAIARTETLRRALVTDVAHELRTPLTNIRAQLESLQDGLASPTPRVIDSLHDDALKLERLVDDLQDLALAEANQLDFRVERLDVSGALSAAAAALETRAARGDVTVAVRPATGVPDVLADPGRLAQILANLLSNALTHTPPGGRIELTARPAESQVEISVSDSGNGISSEDLPHVFDRFYRADPSRARSTGGTGLGLAIVRQLVRSQGGDVRVESEPGRGSVFSFTLPGAK